MEFKIEVLRGAPAISLFADEEFCREWVALYCACRWATAWQSLDFNQVWFATYSSDFEPLILIERDGRGSLSGLFALAIDRRTGEICHSGAVQTEYEVWIARDDRGEPFILGALEALSRLYPKSRLHLEFVPPGSPVAWAGTHARWSKRVIVRREPRWLLSLGANSRVESSLKKSGTRSRINRLRKLGTLELVQISTRSELEAVIEEIEEYHDLRQGARNRVLPFLSDPKKREFWLRLMERPGALCASILLLNNKVIAANLGPIERDAVSIGLFAYSPFYSKYSPGKLLILMLAKRLAENGYSCLDLTPGHDEYKRNTADHHRDSYVMTIYFDPLEGAANWLLEHVRRTMKRLTSEGAVADLRRMASGRSRAAPGSQERQLRRSRSKPGAAPMAQREVTAEHFEVLASDPTLGRNQLGHLIRAANRLRGGRDRFLADALSRIERGDEFFTRSDGGDIVELVWVSGRDP